MRIGRTIPPAAAPISWKNLARAVGSLLSRPQKSAAFTEQLKKYFAVKHCYVVSSGKGALTLILQALHNLSPDRDEVLIPAFTCYSVPASIKKANLKIRLCDIHPKTLDFDPDCLQTYAASEKAAGKLLCVIPTHLFGIPADVESCRKIFPNEVTIIEDAAQAMGSEMEMKKLGTFGDVGFFSLGRGKALSTVEGGIIVTNNDELGKALKVAYTSLQHYSTFEQIVLLAKAWIANTLQIPTLFWVPKNLPFLRLGETLYEPDFTIKKESSIHATLAHGWEKRLQSYQEIRIKNISEFFKLYHDSSAEKHFQWSMAAGQPLIRLPFMVTEQTIRNTLVKDANESGIGVMPAYPTPIHEIPEVCNEFLDEEYPAAKQMSTNLLTIPTHVFMEKKDFRTLEKLLKNRIS